MGGAFDRWLGRPSTICFLRRLLATTEDSGIPNIKRCRNGAQRRRIQSAALTAFPVQDGDGDRRGRTDSIGDSGLIRKHGNRKQQALDTALRISLSAGAQVLEQDIRPEEALSALWQQVNVASKRRLGGLVVDRQEHKKNMKLWVEILQHRQRVDGFPGILDVWKGMRYRQVDLPTTGSEADMLWTTFIHACITTDHDVAHKELLENIMDHAKDLQTRHGVHYPGLYKCVIGRWLRVKPYMIRVWHGRLVQDIDTLNVDLREIADDCAASPDPWEARRSVVKLYDSNKQVGLYDHLMPQVIMRGPDENALRWHRFLLSKGDGPSPEVFALPQVQSLFELDGDKALPMVHAKSPLSSKEQRRLRFPPLTRTTMSILVGDVHGIKPKEVSDNFVAKMFATQAFSLDLVIKGISFFGIEKLGPLALRELAVKAGSTGEFSDKLAELKAMSIDVGSSVYGRLVQKLSVDGQSKLFETLLASDQHPEAYEDFRTQELLLTSFLEQGDLPSAHVTLIALSLTGNEEHARAWNRLLQHYIKSREYGAVAQTMQQMQASDMILTMRTLTFMHRYVLPPRNAGKGPTVTARRVLGISPIQFTTNAYIYAALRNIYVNPSLWVENLKRYAMMHNWQEFERLALWLVSWYAIRLTPKRVRRGGRTIFRPGMLQMIFRPQMRQAVVAWGFRDAAVRRLLYKRPLDRKRKFNRLVLHGQCEPWAKGIFLLKKLAAYGLVTPAETVRHALLTRLWILFGPAYSTKHINEEARQHNMLPLTHYIRHANEVWGEDLFSIDAKLLKDFTENQPKVLIAVFGLRRRVSLRRKEYADVLQYARDLLSRRSKPHGHRNGLVRRRIWERSPYRLAHRPLATSASSDDHNLPPHPPHQ